MMEISRNLTIGQYVNTRSAIHRLDPRVKVGGLIALVIVTSICTTFSALGALVAVAALIQVLSRISWSYVITSMRLVVIVMILFYPLQVVLYQNAGPSPHFYWHWWILNVSREGLAFSALVNLRALLLFYFVNMITLTTTLVDVTDGVEALLSPLQRIGVPVNETTMVMVIALKFVPIFIGELERLIKARAARGVKIDSGNLLQRALNIAPVLIPLIIGGFKRAETLAVAMEARGYHGGRGRTKLRLLRYEGRDLVAVIFLGVAVIGALYINIHAPL